MRKPILFIAFVLGASLSTLASHAFAETTPQAEGSPSVPATETSSKPAAPVVTGDTVIDKHLQDIKQCADAKPAKQAESTNFDSIAAQFGGGTNFVSADVLTGFSRVFAGSGGLWSRPKALGLRLSSAITPTSTTLEDYGDHALLLRGGGVLNLHMSLLGSPDWFSKPCIDEKRDENPDAPLFYRPFQPDRVYISYHPVPPLLRPYFLHGLGVKAVRTGLEDREGEDASGVDAVGIAYAGLGINGPLWDTTEGYSTATPAGTLDLQVVMSAQRLNSSTLRDLYGVDTDLQWLYSGSVRLSMIVTERLSVGVEYAAPLGATKGIIDGVTLLSFGLNRKP